MGEGKFFFKRSETERVHYRSDKSTAAPQVGAYLI